jgi:hypothetical protein
VSPRQITIGKHQLSSSTFRFQTHVIPSPPQT